MLTKQITQSERPVRWTQDRLLTEGILDQPITQIIGKRHAILIEPYDCGSFTIPAGFQFDGASLPTFTWSLLCLEPQGRILAAALPHDLLYVTLGNVRSKDGSWVHYDKKDADRMFYERSQKCGLNWIQSRLVWRAVYWFGHYDIDHHSQTYLWNKEWLKEYEQGVLNG